MGVNGFTQLNIGYDGNYMDETSITYPSAPVDRSRARVIIAGGDIEKLADVSNLQLAGTEYALPVRNISPWQGGLQYEFGFGVYIDDGSSTQQILQFRNTVTNYNILVNSEMPMLVAQTGYIVYVTAENTSTPATCTFESTIIGYTQPV